MNFIALLICFVIQKDRLEKAEDHDAAAAIARPQRFSTTSGVAPAPLKRRTWTVGDVDDGETHRGGKNAKKTRGARPSKNWATGVNMIPVG
jgi:nucleolar protein 6